jgi:uncharacterized protein (TIGR02001 family)
MKKTIKTTAALSVLVASGVMSSVASAELTGNVGVTSNYIWRGVTQSADEAAVSGGIDYAHDSGFYAGAWTSNLSGSQYELDLYAGFGGEAGQMSYDLGVIQYMYPVDDEVEADFTEVYGNVGFGPVTAGVAYTVAKEADVDDENDIYYSLAGDFPVGEETSVGVLFGSYDFDSEAAEDYTHVQLSVSKGDFTFALDKASDYIDDTTVEEDPRVSVSWSHSIDL